MIRKHLDHFITGIGLIAIGFWLIFDNNFFSWPPEVAWFTNDDFWGSLLVFVGFSLVIWVLEGGTSIKWGQRLLVISTVMIAFMAAYQFIIWSQTGVYKSWISNAVFTAFVVSLSRRSDTEHG